MYKILKKDGSKEDFDKTKIVVSVQKAGAQTEVAENIATLVEEWLPEVCENDCLDNQALRDKVYELMAVKDIDSAQRYQNYKRE